MNNKHQKRKQKIRYDRIALLLFIAIFIIVGMTALLRKVNENTEFDKRAVWISYLNMESLKDKDETTFSENFDIMCKRAKSNQLNTLIVHVRPFMDAIYESELFPVSSYIDSDGKLAYDPLTIMVQIAHANDLKLEAWINPYRISYNEAQLTYFKENAVIANWLGSDKILQSGSLAILNPANEDARNYINAGVKEIVDYYDVDGIHMDDYFYVQSLFGNTDRKERANNVNLLIRQLYDTIKNKSATLTLGISPQGNLDNAREIGADIDTWLTKEGYVDYVMPQIYWTNNWSVDGSVEMFSSRVDAYTNLHTNSAKLYCGMALYLTGQDIADDAGWSMYNDNLKRQTELLKDAGWNGYALFDYDSLIEEESQEELNHLNN